ncbi:MAG: hypothetical protein DDT20_00838 [Firmicutes bacterium]|nr:hypothetical protein [Bacillota bacterium]
MATAKEREEFIARFVSEYSQQHAAHEVLTAARALLRYARRHGRLALEECNGPGEYVNQIPYPRAGEIYNEWQTRVERETERVEARMRAVCEPFNLPAHFSGDPRGYTVKVKFPSGASNTWGGSEDGWGVPQ